MTAKELILSAKRIHFVGYCSCGCGEKLYDLWANNGKIYPPIPEKLINEVRPTLLDNIEYYDDYGMID